MLKNILTVLARFTMERPGKSKNLNIMVKENRKVLKYSQ